MELLNEIKHVGKEEIQDVVQAVLERYRELYPEWDINVFSLEKSKDKNEQLDRIIGLAEKLKD